MALKRDLKLLLKPYYIINLLMSLGYLVAKKMPGVCNILFSSAKPVCELDSRETEILFFLAVVVMIRSRKTGSVTMLNYLTSSFVYTKIANLILWFYSDVRMGLVYGVLFVLLGLLVPEPTYSGPDKVTYFRTASGLEDEINNDKRVVWLIAFYTAWNPSCVNFAPVFSQLSADYDLDNLKFGKIDIGRYPEAAVKYHINDSSLSKQLPTIILFKDGKEAVRRPVVDSKGKLIKFFFTEDNIKAAFDLNNLYKECKSNPLKKKKISPVAEDHIKKD
ncbi:thioredoxin-related transmembrane protein 2 homolog [Halyomorpha halys]|uniref:thioredoxin-related transmembrane protein 2 homolog n=1 Tax=Halyomorpha halys TaxID=286706 RepID=UPI0006D52079|nr:thioredoxin-related transmembrane protein 2 homolog [Halyomorpha halys]